VIRGVARWEVGAGGDAVATCSRVEWVENWAAKLIF